jgi:hypothetical protein
MPRTLLDRLDDWKRRFGPPETGELERLLRRISRVRFDSALELIRLHESLLFLRAYPRAPEVARLADAILADFRHRIARLADLTAFEDPEVSGIAGTSLTAVFSREVASALARRYSRSLAIAWDRYDDSARMGPAAARLIPALREDWPVEAHVPFDRWVAAARRPRQSGLAFLLERLGAGPEGAERFEAMAPPLTWQVEPRVSRSSMRLPVRRFFCHDAPLLRRADIDLASELAAPKILVSRVSRAAAGRVLDLILDTSAMRYRELYGFSHPEQSAVYHADAGRGLEIYFFGVPPRWRLPLRAYHGGMFFKNGVPAGYVELLSLCERAEIGFNLYYTFREGESAWIYARLLHLFRQQLGVTVFSVDPYQIGHENSEAIDSGAFWFYRKLGFRPALPAIAALAAREERRMGENPGHRSSRRTLERLAAGHMLYESAGSIAGAWDRFTARDLALRLARESDPLAALCAGLPGAEEILAAKSRGRESRYLRLTQRHGRFRGRAIHWGSPAGAQNGAPGGAIIP